MTLTPGKLILDQTPEVLYDSNESPSLDLRFAENKTLDDYVSGTPLVDHQRSMSGSNLSAGTFVNSSGLIETAKVNYIRYSEDFTDTTWTFSGVTRPAGATSEVTPPGGVNDVYKILETSGTSSEHYFRTPFASLPFAVNTVVTNSIYLNTSLGRSKVRVYSFGQNSLTFIWDLVSNAIVGSFLGGTNPSANSENLGNGWYRFSWTDAATVPGNMQPQIGLVNDSNQFNYIGDITKGMYASGYQLEEGSTATTYIPTTNIASAAPRFDHNPTTGESLGLLIEESRTNYITNSTTLSPLKFNGGTGVVPQVGTVTTVGPDGVSASITRCQLDRGTGNTATDVSTVYFAPTTPPTNANYSQSIWLKSNDSNNYVIIMYDAGGSKGNEFTVTPEWQRFTLDASTSYKNSNDTATTTPSLVVGLRNDPTNANYFTGNTNSQTADILVWGPQIENGTFVTSYIPTAGTALTRNVDVASITGTNFSSWYNQNEGTVFVDASVSYQNGKGLWSLHTGTSTIVSNSIHLTQSNLNRLNYEVYNSVTQSSLISGAILTANNPFNKIAATFKNNDFSVSYNGNTPLVDGSGTLPSSLTTLTLGGRTNNQLTLGRSTISRLTYYPYRLADTRLQSLTA